MASDSLSKSNPQTGTTDIPVVRTDQVENLPRPGGREQYPSGSAESSDFPGSARPGGQEGGMTGGGSDDNVFARPGGSEGWRQ